MSASDAHGPRWWRNERVQAFVLGVATSIVATEVFSAVELAIEQLQGVPPWLIAVVGIVLIALALIVALLRSRRWVARAWGKWLGALTVIAVIAAAFGALITAGSAWSADQRRTLSSGMFDTATLPRRSAPPVT